MPSKSEHAAMNAARRAAKKEAKEAAEKAARRAALRASRKAAKKAAKRAAKKAAKKARRAAAAADAADAGPAAADATAAESWAPGADWCLRCLRTIQPNIEKRISTPVRSLLQHIMTRIVSGWRYPEQASNELKSFTWDDEIAHCMFADPEVRIQPIRKPYNTNTHPEDLAIIFS